MNIQELKEKAPKYMVMVKDTDISNIHTPHTFWYFTAPDLKVAISRMKQQQLLNREMTLTSISLTPVAKKKI